MQQWIENEIQDTYKSMMQAIENNQLELAKQYEQIINDLKEQLNKL